jgi:hypothetical protein
MNKKGELRTLFHNYLDRKEKESKTTSYSDKARFVDNFRGVIYFYEWSDTKREPKCFVTMAYFSYFLQQCGITLLLYQKDVIETMKSVYVACKKGTKELLIRGSLEELRKALEDSEKNFLVPSTEVPRAANAATSNGTWFG